jgi:hypothetical protein
MLYHDGLKNNLYKFLSRDIILISEIASYGAHSTFTERSTFLPYAVYRSFV